MAFSGRTADRLASLGVYVGFGVLTLWVGIALINHALDSKFYKDFLMKWEAALQKYRQESGPWPPFSTHNHVAYMEELTRHMRERQVAPPRSNTERSYVYRLKRIGFRNEDVFVLCLPDRLILYGISGRTFDRLDASIDGVKDPEGGRFTGRRMNDGRGYVGLWRV